MVNTICQVLLENGADVTVPAKLGMTCLHVAVTAGHAEIVQLLLENGADPFVPDVMGNTALDQAKMVNHPELIELMSLRNTDEGVDEEKDDEVN